MPLVLEEALPRNNVGIQDKTAGTIAFPSKSYNATLSVEYNKGEPNAKAQINKGTREADGQGRT
jgi:hypothetical protein